MACELDNYLEPATLQFKLSQLSEINKLQKTVTSLIFSKFLTRRELIALEEICNDIDELAIKTLNLSSDPETTESDFGWIKLSRGFHGMRAVIIANGSELPQHQKLKFKQDIKRFTDQ